VPVPSRSAAATHEPAADPGEALYLAAHETHFRKGDFAAASQRKRSRALKMSLWLPLAAAFVAGTAWAGATGRLAPAVRAIAYAVLPAKPSSSPPPTPSPAAKPVAALEAAPVAEPVPANEPAPLIDPTPAIAAAPAIAPAPTAEPAPAIEAAPSTRVRPKAVPSPANEVEQPATVDDRSSEKVPVPSRSAAATHEPAADPGEALYLAAHETHFRKGDFAAALAAWDRYLAAAPQGQFVPDASFNRAIALFKLGRTQEGVAALKPFAAGAYGGYRRAEAQKLIDAAQKTP